LKLRDSIPLTLRGETMSYRKIQVGGVNYEYVTGKTHTKVKTIGVVENVRIGEYSFSGISPCYYNCGCDPYEYRIVLQVRPKHIKCFIEGILKNMKPSDFVIASTPQGLNANKIHLGVDIFPND